MSVVYQLLDKDGNAIHQHEQYCREVLSQDLNDDLPTSQQIRCFAFDYNEDEDKGYEDDEGNWIEDDSCDWDTAMSEAMEAWTDSYVKSFNRLMAFLLEGKSMKVEMREDTWVYFSETPSFPFFSLVLYLIRHGMTVFSFKKWNGGKNISFELITELLLTCYDDIGMMDTLLTLFYLNTMRTKTSLTFTKAASDDAYIGVIGPALYMENRLIERETTRKAFKKFLTPIKEKVVEIYRATYGSHKFRHFPDQNDQAVDNVIWEILPDDCKTTDGGGWN